MSLKVRSSGILLPIASLPAVETEGRNGRFFRIPCGTLGRSARDFIDFLAKASQRWWQMLPIGHIDAWHSPYSSFSAFAGNTLLIDPEELLNDGLISREDIDVVFSEYAAIYPSDIHKNSVYSNNINKNNSDQNTNKNDSDQNNTNKNDVYQNDLNEGKTVLPEHSSVSSAFSVPDSFSLDRIDYQAAEFLTSRLLKKAFERYQTGIGGDVYRSAEDEFRQKNAFWLFDYSLFASISSFYGDLNWRNWANRELAARVPVALEESRRVFQQECALYEFEQLVFDVQWKRLKEYARQKNVLLLGDVPIYVAPFSVDLWAHQELFQIDAEGNLERVAGVPGDSFNPEGQRWGNPLYDWEKQEKDGFSWWIQRMQHNFQRFDAVRLDHFIGFYNYFSFPNAEKFSDSGYWSDGPKEKFFDVLFSVLPRDSFIAEDLGVMNAGVHALRDHYELPGMNVLQFAFDWRGEGDPSQEWKENSVVCTGTHDTPTVLAWLSDVEKMGINCWNPSNFGYIWRQLLPCQKAEEKIPVSETQQRLYSLLQMSEIRRCLPEPLSGLTISDILDAQRTDSKSPLSDQTDTWFWSLEQNGSPNFEPIQNQNSEQPSILSEMEQPQNSVETDQSSILSKSKQKNVWTEKAMKESKAFLSEEKLIRPEISALKTALIRMVMQSAGNVALFPIQDILGLGYSARINFPGQTDSNWIWRLEPGLLNDSLAEKIRMLTIENRRVVL